MQPHFGIPADHRGVLPSLNLRRGAPKPNLDNVETKGEKIKRMNLMYRNPSVPGDNREALSKGVLAGLDPDAKRGQHPADNEVLEWMRNERKRQEERAEKRWRAKFQEWVALGKIPGADDCGGGGRKGSSRNSKSSKGQDQDMSSFDGSPSMLRRSGSLGSFLMGGNAGDREPAETISRLEEYCRRLRKDLNAERRAREALHRQAQETVADRDSWRLKAAQLEEQLQEVCSQKRGAGKKVAELGHLLGELGAAPAEPPSPTSPASPAAAAVGSSEPLLEPATPPAVRPPPARPAAETVTEPAEEDQALDQQIEKEEKEEEDQEDEKEQTDVATDLKTEVAADGEAAADDEMYQSY
mmetsp:Transcript_38070/g.100532  ORF Transcript_38070/g.100532 Transcript_38070/m.100532 type:complete len:355 (-) Transcript_38070:83-1147(-)